MTPCCIAPSLHVALIPQVWYAGSHLFLIFLTKMQSNLNPIKERRQRKQIAIDVGWIALAIALVIFSFQTAQGAVDAKTSPQIMRWLFPLSLASAFALAALIEMIHRMARIPDDARSPEEAYAKSLVAYVQHLRTEGRDQAVVLLRNHSWHTLHTLGFHEDRIRLGEMALEAATILKDRATAAEVLIDDLGWARYLIKQPTEARTVILKGVDIAMAWRAADPETSVRLALCEAKGLRHLGMIDYKDPQASKQHFDDAMKVLEELTQKGITTVAVRRDIAQIHHARALSRAQLLGIHKEGSIREGDIEGRAEIDEALSQTRQSVEIFSEIGDYGRHAKALALEVRLLEAKRDEIDARAVAALRDRVLASSQWDTAEGQRTLTGI